MRNKIIAAVITIAALGGGVAAAVAPAAASPVAATPYSFYHE